MKIGVILGYDDGNVDEIKEFGGPDIPRVELEGSFSVIHWEKCWIVTFPGQTRRIG